MFTLIIYLWLCSCSSHVLFATTVPRQALNVSMERSFTSRSNPSFIQSVMVWGLSFLRSLLTYKALLIVIPIFMIWMVYVEDDISSLQQTPLKKTVPEKRRSDQQWKVPEIRRSGQQRKYIPGLSGPSSLSRSRTQSDTERAKVETQPSKKSETQQKKESLNVFKEEDREKSSSSQKNERITNPPKPTITEPPKPTITESPKPTITKPPKPTITESPKPTITEITEPTITESPKPTITEITEPNITESPKPKHHITECLEPKCPERREKSNNESPSITMNPPRNKFIGDGPVEEGWVQMEHEGKCICIYDPSSKGSNEQRTYTISNLPILSNFFVPHQSNHALWISRGFYTEIDIKNLYKTSKYMYFQYKKLPGMRRDKSYMLHSAYKTCVIDMLLRWVIKDGMSKSFYTGHILDSFESKYKALLENAKKAHGIISYESFRISIFPLVDFHIYDRTIIHYFLTRMFLKKREWTISDLERLKNTLKEELMQTIEVWSQSLNYNFVPPVNQVVDQSLYERLLKKMQSMNVPFCNCFYISRLLISSQGAPLKLFLFWDIFNTFKIDVLSCFQMKRDIILPFKQKWWVKERVEKVIVGVYSGQDNLQELYFELIGFIQNDFFENNQRHKEEFQEPPQYQNAFYDYMQEIQIQVERFLTTEVFHHSLLAIRL